MRSCPRCKTPYHTDIEFCGIDGAKLVEHDTDPLVGSTLDRYRVVERLGGGGMAAVYRAVHLVIDKECALKVMFGELASDPAFTARFRREAQTASRIKHENVVDILDFGTTPEGASFLLMELLRGRTLSVLLSAGALTPERAAWLTRQIACGLAAAHAHGFIHRDLKPANIMVLDDVDGGPRELAKILDFGLVTTRDKRGDDDLTKTGQTLGTPSYMAPEQIQGLECTERSDLYSLGVILYEMIAGARPFKGSLGEVLGQHTTAPPPALPAAGGLEKLALRLLAKKPADRPASAADVVRAIEALGLLPVGELPARLPDKAAVTARAEAARVVESALADNSAPPGSGARTDNELAAALSSSLREAASAPTEGAFAAAVGIPPTAPTRVLGANAAPLARGGRARALLFVGVVFAAAVAGGVFVFSGELGGDAFERVRGAGPDAQNAAIGLGAKAVDLALPDPLADANAKANLNGNAGAPLHADAGVVDDDGDDGKGDAKAPPSASTKAMKAAVERANDDVANALRRRGFTHADMGLMPSLRASNAAFERSKNGTDASAVRTAAATLLHEIARAPVSAKELDRELDRISRLFGERGPKLSKKQAASFAHRLKDLHDRARQARSEAEHNVVFLDGHALEEALTKAGH